MECPECGAELKCIDGYIDNNGICNKIYDENGKEVKIYRCSNVKGFDTVEDVLEYIDGNEDDLEECLRFYNLNSWEDIKCKSQYYNGMFYLDNRGRLNPLMPGEQEGEW